MTEARTIARGLRALGYSEFAVRGTAIEGIAEPPSMEAILAAAATYTAKLAAASVSREEALEALLEHCAKLATYPQAVKDYVAAKEAKG